MSRADHVVVWRTPRDVRLEPARCVAEGRKAGSERSRRPTRDVPSQLGAMQVPMLFAKARSLRHRPARAAAEADDGDVDVSCLSQVTMSRTVGPTESGVESS